MPSNSKKFSENQTEANRTEQKREGTENEIKRNENIADKNIDFVPKNELESVAFETWKRLEPYNKRALHTTYLNFANNGLPAGVFGVIASEIEQSGPKNKGAVFYVKARNYLDKSKKPQVNIIP